MGTFLVGAILAVIFFLIVYKMYKDKKQGKSSCGCGCKDCAMSDMCHKKDDK